MLKRCIKGINVKAINVKAINVKAINVNGKHFSFLSKLTFNFDSQLSEDEKLIQETARHFAQNSLQPRVLDSFRNETFDKNIMKEICELAKADNCELPIDVIEKNIVATQKMKPYKTSMLLDFEAGREMEVEAILGNAIKFAQSKSMSTPYLSTIYAIIANY